MKKRSLREFLSIFLLAFFMCLFVMLLIFSFAYEDYGGIDENKVELQEQPDACCVKDIDKNTGAEKYICLCQDNSKGNENAIKLLGFIYLVVIAIYVIIYTVSQKKDNEFTKVSLWSIVNYCLYYPTAISMVIICANHVFTRKPNDIIGAIVVFIHILFIILWHYPKLRNSDIDENDLMKIDFYVTFAMLPLTFVWIIYRINLIKYGFAAFMVIFLVIQIRIKYILIKKAEQKTNGMEKEVEEKETEK